MLIVFLYLALYFLPGFIFSRLTKGKLKNNPFLWLFLSSITVPFIYIVLIYSKTLSLTNYLLSLIILLAIGLVVNKKFRGSSLNWDNTFPVDKERSPFKWLSYLILGLFLLLLLLPRIGLWEEKFPIGDDRHRMGKIVSIAESPDKPLFYRFPVTPLTIYYFDQIQSGLITKFSNNEIKINQAWVIHNFLRGLVLLWMIWLAATFITKNSLGRLTVVFGLTFSGGLEYYLKLIKGVNINHIEWWTDWWGKPFFIHMQISNPFTSAFWVPQHFLAGLLTIPLYLVLISKEKEKIIGKILFSLILVSILGLSAFVFMTVVLALILYYLLRLLTKQERLLPLIKDNLFLVILSLILASPLLFLFATADKGQYFSFGLVSFQFLNNYFLPFKILNFLVTIPYFLTVELSLLVLVLIFGLWYFFREKLWRSSMLFWYLCLLPFAIMFFVRAADDNNISMRSTVPSQVTLALLAGLFVPRFFEFIKAKTNFKITLTVGVFSFLFLIPSNLAEFYFRFSGQFTEEYGLTDRLFGEMDKTLPLNSIIFTPVPLQDSLTALTHRFTFKPLYYFNATDKEYAALSKLLKYDLNYDNVGDIKVLLNQNPQLKNYHLYLLELNSNLKEKGLKKIESSDKLSLFSLEGI